MNDHIFMQFKTIHIVVNLSHLTGESRPYPNILGFQRRIGGRRAALKVRSDKLTISGDEENYH